MSNFNQVNRRSFLKASSIGTAVAVADITLPFNVMAADAPKIRKKVKKSGMECMHCKLWESLSITYAC